MRNKFDMQLERLNSQLTHMGEMCEIAITRATKALEDGKVDEAKAVQEADEEIDQLEKDIERLCLKLLLQQQPVARDLRQVSAALRMISDMERFGDQASDIVENARYIQDNTYESNLHIRDMAEATMKMVTDSIDSFVKRDLELARKTMKEDDEVDELFNKVKTELIGLIGEDSSKGEMCLDLLMIAKYLERIGDHAVNVCEWTQFCKTGALKNVRIM